MVSRPIPASMIMIERAASANAPIAFISIMQAVDAVAEGIVQLNLLIAIAQPSLPAADDIVHGRILVAERISIGRDHQVGARAETHVGESELDPRLEAPAGEVYFVGPRVE